eukprot:CAMPEP_0113935976 /NCGR_PEP_ID=MMETSP1339-20121228/2984_1 /TAXON_ID=94617 /ORGANISM="Fibrocapsa japonica" /LENGTH=186 /DNA_ID=CAMNT_0000938285 /DNA_START=133 /DNA_END=693 /DNA_ORIENTATION=- /assembly_acc=CAM_ASM_000762
MSFGVFGLETLLSSVPWDIPMCDHVFDLALHREDEQHKEVEQQDWPEDRNVEHLEECHKEGDDDSPSAGVPELKLRQAPGEGPELVRIFRREHRPIRVRVHLWREETNEVVEEEDAQPIGHNVPPIHQVHPECIDSKTKDKEPPPRHRVDRRFIQKVLVSPGQCKPELFEKCSLFIHFASVFSESQ